MARRESTRVVGLLEKATTRTVRRVVLQITSNLVETTPVLSGWARSNWIPSIKLPRTEPVGSKVAIDKGARSRGEASIATSYNISDGPAWITNNVPYIERLDEGESAKAPAGFVEDAIQRAVDLVNRSPVK